MIRILQVVTIMDRGGLETMIMNYYRNVDRNKVQFDFLTHRDSDGAYGEEIKSLGGKIYHLPKLNPFSYSYKKALAMFFKEHSEYKIIHVHQDCMSSVILKMAKKCGISVRIAHSHNTSQDKNLKYPIKLFYRKHIAKYATELMACSKDAGNWMFCGAPFRVLNNAIDSEKYIYNIEKRQTVREQLGILNNEIVIGHVGRFYPQKNHTYLIDIFYQIRTNYPNSKLLLIGDDKGEIADKVKDKINDLRLSNSVIFAGVRNDVADLMQAMDAFVFPSIYEGLPVTVIEAQAAGLKCFISSNITDEVCITDLVERISINIHAREWADKIFDAGDFDHKNTRQDVISAGYEIQSAAQWLTQFYMNSIGENDSDRSKETD